MFNQFEFRYVLQADVKLSKKINPKEEFRYSQKTEYVGASFDKINEEFRKDYNIPEDFKLKSEFEFEGNSFKLKYSCWSSGKEIFDPFDEVEDEE